MLSLVLLLVAPGCVAASTEPVPIAPVDGGRTLALTSPGPGKLAARTMRLGVPVGWPRTGEGARDAAAGYVRSTGVVMSVGPLQRRDVIGVLASARYTPELVELTDRRVDDLLFALGARSIAPAELDYHEFSLTARTDTNTPDRVSARVWSLITITTRGASVPRQQWRTSSIELVWEADDWKVDRWESTNGPTPALPTEAVISPNGAVADASGWPPLESGGPDDGS